MNIQFHTDNAVFEENFAEEVGAILKHIVLLIEGGKEEGPIFDSNGNKVGKWTTR